MTDLKQAAQQALEALVTCCAEEWRTLNNFGMKQVYDEKKVNAAIAALHAALAEPRPIQECYGDCPTDPATCLNPCNFEGRPKPEQKPQTTHWEGCEAVHPECKTEHGVKDLSNYEFKTYNIGGFHLEAGFYSTDELRDLIKAFDKMNAATERSMRRMK